MSSFPGAMYLAHRISWLVLGLTVVLVPACHSQNELLLRSVQPPYPLSFSISQVTGSSKTYGPTDPTVPDKAYRTLTLHDGKLFVGGKAQLFSVDPEDLNTFRSVSFPPNMSDNYIRVIHNLSADVLLECGTNGRAPYCQQRYSQNLSEVEGSRYDFANGDYVVPAFANQNTSWLLLLNGTDYQIYAGTNLAITAGSLTDPAIIKARLKADSTDAAVEVSLKTKNNPETVLKDPQFVGEPVEYNGRIYFFFREVASEYTDGGTIIYSRVAMVCMNDTGGRDNTALGSSEMVTFVKARLDCSTGGAFPYDYNEIQDVYYSNNSDEVVFAVFATRSPEVAGSAVCAYRLEDIEALFLNGQFRAQIADAELWRTLETDPVTPRQATCHNGTIYSDAEYTKILNWGQLMADTAANKLHYESPSGIRSNPLLVSYGERFSQIVVDEDVLNSIDVMFIGTENGTVLKAYLNDDRSEARIVEEISLNTAGQTTPVLTMLKSDQAVFVGTDIGVYKIPFQHCQDFSTLQTCLDARDPYCRWTGDSCSSVTHGQQDLESGAGNLINDSESDTISISMSPIGQARTLNVSDQPINLFLLAEAREGLNLRVVGEINCSSCASLPFQEYRSMSFGNEYLVLLINGSSTENATCLCSCVLADDNGVSASVRFTLTADTSADMSPNVTALELDALEELDYNILEYKELLRKWKEKVAGEFDLTGVCTAYGCL